MFSILTDKDFTIFSEEVEGLVWVHFECTRFNTSSYRRLVKFVNNKIQEYGTVYGSIGNTNKSMRKLSEKLGFKHLYNVRTKEGVRSIYFMESKDVKCNNSS